VVSLSIDFYVRLFVRVYTSPLNVKLSASKQSHVYQCVGCESFHLNRLGKVYQNKDKQTKYTPGLAPPVDRLCATCGSVFKVQRPPPLTARQCSAAYMLCCAVLCCAVVWEQLGGPIWSEPMHDTSFVKAMLQALDAAPDTYATHARMSGMLSAVMDVCVCTRLRPALRLAVPCSTASPAVV
jgi:tRNA (guanine26-N2/guanine27-N2)-dimethyltransferase